MVIATPAAIAKLGELIVEHPEAPVVRLTIVLRDDDRIVFGITLDPISSLRALQSFSASC